MKKQYRFIISYICDNQPNSMEVSSHRETLGREEVERYIKLAHPSTESRITDIQIIGLHHDNNPEVHPGHYQQPEGNG